MARRSGRRGVSTYYRQGNPVRGYTRGSPRGLYVDQDFKSRAKFRGGQLAGRKEVSGFGDRTAVRRDSKGRILGRVPSFKMKKGKVIIPKTVRVRTSHGIKELKVKQVRAK